MAYQNSKSLTGHLNTKNTKPNEIKHFSNLCHRIDTLRAQIRVGDEGEIAQKYGFHVKKWVKVSQNAGEY